MNPKSFAAAMLLLALARPAQAELIYAQNFDALTPGGLNGQAGFNAPATTTVSTANLLTYANGGLSYGGGAQGGVATGLTNAYAFSTGFTAQTGDVYFSLLCAWSGQLDNDIVVCALSGQTTLPAAPDLRAAGGVRVNNNAHSGGEANFVNIHARAVDGSSSTVTLTGPAGKTQGTANFLVGKVWKSVPGAATPYDRVSIWVNPTGTPEGAPTLTVSQTLSVATLNKLYLMVGGGNEADEVLRFDNLLVGTTYGDVVPSASMPTDPSRGTVILISALDAAAPRPAPAATLPLPAPAAAKTNA